MAVDLSREFLQEHYFDLKKSPATIAREVDSYPNAVRRALLKYWPPSALRDQSAAQAAALETGAATHPTEGRPRPYETRLKMGRAITEAFAKKSRERLTAQGQKRWDKLRTVHQKQFLRDGLKASRETARAGSKAEHFFADALRAAGRTVEHRAGFGDILLPTDRVAVFVDGPPLLRPVWGEAVFARITERAVARRAKAVAAGLRVVRVCVESGKPSLTLLNDLLTKLESVLSLTTVDSVPSEIEVRA